MLAKWIGLFSVIDFISAGMLVSVVAMNSLKRIDGCIKAYAANSWLLASMMGASAVYLSEPHLYAAAFYTIAVKCIGIPYVLKRVAKELKVTRETDPYVSGPVSTMASFALVGIVYSALSRGISVTGFAQNSLEVAVSIILVSLFTMMIRGKAITQVIGLLFMENGLFLAGFSLTRGMPTLVELGVLFDLFMGVLILGVFLSQIKKTFVSVDLDRLTNLKG